jgi:hypothetical protein
VSMNMQDGERTTTSQVETTYIERAKLATSESGQNHIFFEVVLCPCPCAKFVNLLFSTL